MAPKKGDGGNTKNRPSVIVKNESTTNKTSEESADVLTLKKEFSGLVNVVTRESELTSGTSRYHNDRKYRTLVNRKFLSTSYYHALQTKIKNLQSFEKYVESRCEEINTEFANYLSKK